MHIGSDNIKTALLFDFNLVEMQLVITILDGIVREVSEEHLTIAHLSYGFTYWYMKI